MDAIASTRPDDDLDMDQVAAELHEALAYIEGLRHWHPDR